MTETTLGRTIDLDPQGRDLLIRFPYDPAIIPVVRSLPGRRWNPQDKTWAVSHTVARQAVQILEPLGFSLTPSVKELLSTPSESTIEPDATLTPRVAPEPEKRTLKVSDLNRQVREALWNAFPNSVWITGETIEWDRNTHKKHVYFRLAEREEGQARPLASVTAVVFERVRGLIEERLRASGDGFELRDGIEIRVLARVDLYPASGSYQLIVEDIDPYFTMGKMAQNRAKILDELDRRGLRDRNRALPLPVLPLRIALITSAGSDAYNDFVNEIGKSGYRFEIEVYDAHMQGRRMPSTLRNALNTVTERRDRYDVAVLVRGGGSRADLAWFDNLELAITVAESPLKIFCGIGHHRDVSVLDLIASSAKTPTAVAGELIQRVHSALEALHRSRDALLAQCNTRIQEGARWVRDAAITLHRESRRTLGAHRLRIEDKWHRLTLAGRRCIADGNACLSRSIVRGQVSARLRIESAERSLTTVEHRFHRKTLLRSCRRDRNEMRSRLERLLAVAKRRVNLEKRRIDELEKHRQALDPKSVLRRGFALLRSQSGTVIRSGRDLQMGQQVTIDLSDAKVAARVERIAATEVAAQTTSARTERPNPTQGA